MNSYISHQMLLTSLINLSFSSSFIKSFTQDDEKFTFLKKLVI